MNRPCAACGEPLSILSGSSRRYHDGCKVKAVRPSRLRVPSPAQVAARASVPEIQRLADLGMSATRIAERLGLTKGQVIGRAYRYGIIWPADRDRMARQGIASSPRAAAPVASRGGYTMFAGRDADIARRALRSNTPVAFLE